MSEKTNISGKIGKGLNYLGIQILKAVSLLPFWLLYGISDILALFLQYTIRYRKEVINNNIRNSFPEKSDDEVQTVVRKFYRHFSDLIIETIKGYRMSLKDFRKRITFHGIEKMDDYFQQGRSILLFGMHYNNWEWSAFIPKVAKHQYLGVYYPIRGNPLFEEFMLEVRERWGGKTIPIHKSARSALEFHHDQIPVVLCLVADQRPPLITRFWTIFLNQETCFYSGPEKIAHKTNQPVFFHLTRKIKRGFYEVSFVPLISNPAEVNEEDIMLKYARTMEKYISEAPEYYLWSHRRWKQKRPSDYPLI